MFRNLERKKLSLGHCRSVLGDHLTISDAEVLRLRDELYLLAEVTLEGLRGREQRQRSGRPSFVIQNLSATQTPSSPLSVVPAKERESFAERAAILEFETGLSREDAERRALLEWAGHRNDRSSSKKRESARKSKVQ